MINAKELALQLDRFLKSPTCQNARVMIKLPAGEYRSPDGCVDIKSITLFENNLIGARESHRILIKFLQLRVGKWVRLRRKYKTEITAKTWQSRRQNFGSIGRKIHLIFCGQGLKILAV